jgi:peptidoglycan-associated lipoprotein
MKSNNVQKKLLLAMLVLAITACSVPKNETNDQSTVGVTTENVNNTLSPEERTRLLMQELQKSNTVYFGFDKYDIDSDFFQILDAHAVFLRDNPSYKVIVEGHADERGTPEYNIALGERRANAVRMYLQGKGVFSEQISIVAYGKEKPLVLGHDEAAWAKNRRAVLVY